MFFLVHVKAYQWICFRRLIQNLEEHNRFDTVKLWQLFSFLEMVCTCIYEVLMQFAFRFGLCTLSDRTTCVDYMINQSLFIFHVVVHVVVH